MNNNQNLLIEKYLAETLSIDEKEELVEQVRSSDEFSKEFNNAIQMKGLLYTSTYDEPLVIEVMDKVLEADLNLENRIMGQIPKKKTFSVYNILKFSAAAALVFIFIKLGTDKINTVASIDKSPETLIKRANGKTASSNILLINDTIQTGSSNEKINFNDGTKLNLKGRSELKLLSKNPKIFELNKGSLTAEVTPQDKAMKIETPSATIEVLGTIFNLSSQESNSLLKVSKGKVAITDKKTGERVTVTKGEYTLAEGKELNIRKGKGPLYVSDTISSKSSRRYIDIEVDLNGEKQLILICHNAGDGNKLDHTAWLNPVININGRWTSLTKLKPKRSKVGNENLRIFTDNSEANQLMLQGKSYARGFYAHATSVLIWDLPPDTRMLKCRGAVLDSAISSDGNFSAKFEVYSEMSPKLLDSFLQKKEDY